MAGVASGFFVALSEVADGVLAVFLLAASTGLVSAVGFTVVLGVLLIDFAVGVDAGFLAAVEATSGRLLVAVTLLLVGCRVAWVSFTGLAGFLTTDFACAEEGDDAGAARGVGATGSASSSE